MSKALLPAATDFPSLKLRDGNLDIVDPGRDRGRVVVPANWDG